MKTLKFQCPYCQAGQQLEHKGNYAPVYVDCQVCERRFIVEPLADGVAVFKEGEAPCCSDPDCRAVEMGAGDD
jgi:uncharacterized protein (DUF983 family)